MHARSKRQKVSICEVLADREVRTPTPPPYRRYLDLPHKPHVLTSRTSRTQKRMSQRNNQDIDEPIKDIDPLLSSSLSTSADSINQTTSTKHPNNASPSQMTAITAALSYAISSIGIQVALKMTLTSMAFPSSLFVALAQCIFTVFGLFVLYLLGYVTFPAPSWSNMMAVQPLPLIQIFNVACGLIGTKLISIPMFTVLRRVSIPMTLLAEVYILTMPTTKSIVASVVLLMLGSVIAAFNDLSFNFVGYVSILISAVATTAYGTSSKMLLTGPKQRTKWELLFYNSLFAIPILSVAIHYRGDGYSAVYNYDQWYNLKFLAMMTVSVTMGFVLNFAILWNTQTNGPLSTTVMGSAKNVLTTYLGILGLGGDYIFTVTNFLGLNISMGGALLYSYVKFKAKSPKSSNTKEKKGDDV
jgi:hypothetical protein